jgi:hypothetical protein
MKTLNFRVVPLSTEVADSARRRATMGAQDHVFVTADLPLAFPCRHCLRWAKPGERLVLFPFSAIPPGYPYSESGPIFVHAEPCARYGATNEYPAEFRNGRVFRAYDSSKRIIDAQVANGTPPEGVIEHLFGNPDTAFVHARSVTHGCYTFAIARV